MPSVPQLQTLLAELQEVKNLLAEMNKYRFAEQYIDNDEFTQLLKVSKKTAQLWRQSALIPFAQIGKKIYYRLSDIEGLFDTMFEKPKRLKQPAAKRKRIPQDPESNGWVIKV